MTAKMSGKRFWLPSPTMWSTWNFLTRKRFGWWLLSPWYIVFTLILDPHKPKNCIIWSFNYEPKITATFILYLPSTVHCHRYLLSQKVVWRQPVGDSTWMFRKGLNVVLTETWIGCWGLYVAWIQYWGVVEMVKKSYPNLIESSLWVEGRDGGSHVAPQSIVLGRMHNTTAIPRFTLVSWPKPHVRFLPVI